MKKMPTFAQRSENCAPHKFRPQHTELMTARTRVLPVIIHKSQDVSDGNLTNSKIQRLLREAYAMPYSVSPCMFLYWALSEPPSEAAWVSRFFNFKEG